MTTGTANAELAPRNATAKTAAMELDFVTRDI
jgi:hypothetical protein